MHPGQTHSKWVRNITAISRTNAWQLLPDKFKWRSRQNKFKLANHAGLTRNLTNLPGKFKWPIMPEINSNFGGRKTNGQLLQNKTNLVDTPGEETK
jgi:hypothetical protein